MNKQPALPRRILSFFLTKIVAGIVVVGGLVVLVEWAGRALLNKTYIPVEIKNVIISITDSVAALLGYILLFAWYEKRPIKELSLATFPKNASIGFLTGLAFQSLLILVIVIAGGYSINRINPVSFLFPAFTTALPAGFVAEIMIRGIIFRITEEKAGTVIALIISVLLFVVGHITVKGATLLSVLSTALQAGFLLSSTYVFTRSLWFAIFFHFAWDFAEPGIFGAINPGNTIEKSWFTSEITGSRLVTGGQFGPENSLQAILLYTIAGLLFLWLAKRKNQIIKPSWKK